MVPIHLGQDPAVCEQGTAAPDSAPPDPCCRGRASLLQGPGLLRFTLGDTRHPVTPPAPLLPTAPTQLPLGDSGGPRKKLRVAPPPPGPA
ncbi:unnamed protein product [Gadus morhua 'NCC']